ncbi:MAG: LLM class flavin-dependent oxidoreductase [Thermoleophilia bacterium]|nr:LLM class flavin-dependent oxidoreductase [Thermoleophilia bacterium]
MDFSMLWATSALHDQPETINETIEHAVALEELGYDCVWFAEHHFGEYGRPCPEMMAATVAARTSRIDIGIGVIVLPWHHPIDVAERVALLDHLSNGRVRFGVGRGMQPAEFEGYNISLWEAKERFEESLEAIINLWTNDTYAHNGKYWQFPGIRLLPKPLQKPYPPLYQPALSDTTVRKIVDRGINGLIGPFLTPWQLLKENYFEPWNEITAEKGRTDLKLVHNEFVYVAETDEQAYREAKEAAIWYPRKAGELWASHDASTAPPDYAWLTPVIEKFSKLEYDEIYNDLSLIGSPETVIRKLKFFEDCGVDELICFTRFGPPMSHELALRSSELFAKHVMPEFKRTRTAK